MPPPPQLSPEGNTTAVAFRGCTPCGTVACPQTPRGVRTRHRALAAECLRRGGHCGGVLSHSTWMDACFYSFSHPGELLRDDTTTRQFFYHGGATSAGLRIGNMNDKCNIEGSVMVLLCCANCVNFSIYIPCVGAFHDALPLWHV
ncbi:hypothetical protein TcG_08363 [Trypanosoma cruzi]|nr:hypothetical protein TcG_08363 [Trypanosoma cruzi]